MTEIPEVKTLNTLASIRKATQECMKPTIEEIERKMTSLSKETASLIAKTAEMKEMQRRQNKTDDNMRDMNKVLMEVRGLCQDVQLNLARDQQKNLTNEQLLRDEIRKLKEDRSKQNTTIELMNQRSTKMLEDVKENMKKMQARELVIEERFKVFNDRAETMNFSIKNSTQEMKNQFDMVRKKLDIQLNASSKRLQLLDNYEMQKEVVNDHLKELEERLRITVTRQEFENYKLQQRQELQRIVKQIQLSLDEAVPSNMKDLLAQLPVIKEELKHCLKFEKQIARVREESQHKNLSLQRIIADEKEYRNRRQEELRDSIAGIRQEQQRMRVDIQKSLSFQQQMNFKLNQYSQQLKTELRSEARVQSKQLYQQIKETFADKTQKQRQVELQRIQEQRDRIFERANEIQDLGNRISQVLTNYSAKITLIRSDTELFEKRVRKDLKQLDQLRGVMAEQAGQTGTLMAQIMESFLLQQCLEIQKETPEGEEVAFTTDTDGIIYQHGSKNIGEVGTISYRKRRMKTRVLRRALFAGLMSSYDSLHSQNHHLGWWTEGPAFFFKQQVEPVYRNLLDKSIACDDDKPTLTRTMRDPQPDGVSTLREGAFSSIDEPTRRYSTLRSRKRSRYDDSNSKFLAHKSARRVNGNLNYTLSLAS